ncbi:MAG: S-layer homology domain-containing protein [Oscillospiraceae bacterium]|jgi:hypothetical protein|nr:S-layer homology domain-containing protein [Oscillospiraceae bacterium]
MKRSIRKVLALLLVTASICALVVSATALANDTTINIGSPKNNVPIAENLEYTTFKGVALTGKFKALDPDGDTLSFEIVAAPKKGSVSPTQNGEFVYTPAEGKKGKDTFKYVAVDSLGGVSASATVTVNINKQSSKTTYADMDGNDALYAALVLTENGIFTGEKLGGEYFFRPEQTITRGEFLAMCLSLTNTETITGITKTGFADDADIPMWAKPYVSAGLMNGVVGGYRNGAGQLVFSPNEPITFTEAAVILNRSLGITDVVGAAAIPVDSVPAWAQSAAVNLAACNILPNGLSAVAKDTLTRADAARLLLNSMEVLAARDTGGGGLLSWAR